MGCPVHVAHKNPNQSINQAIKAWFENDSQSEKKELIHKDIENFKGESIQVVTVVTGHSKQVTRFFEGIGSVSLPDDLRCQHEKPQGVALGPAAAILRHGSCRLCVDV